MHSLAYSTLVLAFVLISTACGADADATGWDLSDGCVLDPAGCLEPRPELACNGSLPERGTLTPEGTVEGSIAIGPEGCPRVSYYRDQQFEYAWWDGSAWQVEIVEEAEGRWPHRLVVDEQDRPSLAYFDHRDEKLMFAARDPDGDWQVEEVGAVDVWDLLYARDRQGRPLVVTQSHTAPGGQHHGGRPVYAFTRTEGRWQRQTIHSDATETYLLPPLVFDSSGNPHMPLSDDNRSDDTLLYFTGRTDVGEPSWQAERIEQGSIDTYQSALALVDDKPHILSCRSNSSQNRAVDHIFKRDGQWQTEVIDTCADGPCWCRTAGADGRGRFHVLYGRTEEGLGSQEVQLVHGRWDSEAWQLSELGSFDRGSIDMEIDRRAGIIHILAQTYRGDGGRRLVYFHVSTDAM